jgi:hypothetical protein
MNTKTNKPTKYCHYCGRIMTYRKAWAQNWQQLKYCSRGCRQRGGQIVNNKKIETMILALLQHRGYNKSICTSEVAKQLDPNSWRDHAENVRCAARRLWLRGQVNITQNSQSVEPSRARGAIHIRLKRDNYDKT